MPRVNVAKAVPDLYRAVVQLDTAVAQSGIDRRFLHLIKLRASQINGCAYCVDMHVKEALKDGLPAQTLHLLSVWRESPLFDNRDRAVLGWTESLTLLADTSAPDDSYEAVRAIFSDEEIGRFTVAIATINVWNRIAVSSRLMHPIDSKPG